MKTTKCMRMCGLALAAGGLMLVSGCAVDQNGHLALVMPQVIVAPPVVYAQPSVYVAAPRPVLVEAPQVVVEEPVMVPENYVMVDGEYVGLVGDQYFYLGVGGVWLVCDPVRLERFHGWERDHRDWREHATRNDRFRKDARGHEQPMRGKAAPKKNNEKDEH
jgi:hypothetical protein